MPLSTSIWRPTDLLYFEEGSITSLGLSTYWHAINAVFQDWDKTQFRLQGPALQHQSNITQPQVHSFHRQRPAVQDKYHYQKVQHRRLPSTFSSLVLLTWETIHSVFLWNWYRLKAVLSSIPVLCDKATTYLEAESRI